MRGVESGVARTTVWVCVTLTLAAALIRPGRWQVAGGVLAGGLLVGLSAWAIRGVVEGVLGQGTARPAPALVLVKFFTRHVILALAAYGMMVRLHLDPVGMLVGVSSLVIAAGVEALRRLQRFS
jgi:hypothetical protein